MRQDLSLRYADITDPTQFNRIYKAMVMAANASHVKPATKKYLRNEFEEDRSEPYFITDGPKILGAAIMTPFPDDPYLYDFVLYKRYQGKGYGKPALDAVLQHLSNRGKPIELDVGYDNYKAQHLYEQAGFKKEHEWKSTGNWHMKKDAATISFLLEKQAADKEERTLRRLAKPYYVAHGNNSWDHIKQVYTNADAMTRQIYGRPLTLSEKAAIFFHDSAVLSKGRKNHGQNARNLAIPLLLSTGFFDQQQLDDIGQAILEHDTLDNKGGPFTSTTGEILASADTEPPDMPWILNKMYGWHIKNTPNKEDWKQGIYDSVQEYFGPGVNALQPPLYNKFHKDRRQVMKEQMNSLSADELWDIVTKYRKKHHIGEDEIRYPNTTLLKAAKLLCYSCC